MKNNILRATLLFLLILPATVSLTFSVTNAADSWVAEFEDICSKTDVSDSLSTETLQSLIDRCDKLKTIIESSDNVQKKVYLFRLDKCRRLFSYSVEVRGQKK